ncbi:MAG: serine/threonine-protein phosphatase 6 regulatory ankyrin repeat subunit B-like isoform [Armatimonadetes bacterium]|jgi:ankyrin repeat protein|nr:serine/threonine-protein phosphatase 6 regulatory ankyrin repeat subunit B-like isoform [Armatimonadota bacterium]
MTRRSLRAVIAVSGLSLLLLGWQYQSTVAPRRVAAQRQQQVDALAAAVDAGDSDTVASLLNAGTPVAMSADGLHPLHLAAWRGDPAIMEMLLVTAPEVDVEDWLGKTPLMRAVERSRTVAAGMLLDRGAKIEARDRLGYTPLLLAARAGHLEGVAMLLKRGADARAKRPDGLTAVLATAKIPRYQLPPDTRQNTQSRVEVVKLLLRHQADFNARTSAGMSLVSLAVENNYPDLLRFAIEKGASLQAPARDGTVPIVAAAGRGNVECFRILVEHGVSVETRSPSGETLLSLALDGYSTEFGRSHPAWLPRPPRRRRREVPADAQVRAREYRSIVEVLLARGVSVQHRTRSGGYPLCTAAAAGDVALCEELIRRGNPLEGRDQAGRTALMHAADSARMETVRYLLGKGADPRVRTPDGDTALSLLEQPRKNEIPANLQKHQAVISVLRGALGQTERAPQVATAIRVPVGPAGR